MAMRREIQAMIKHLGKTNLRGEIKSFVEAYLRSFSGRFKLVGFPFIMNISKLDIYVIMPIFWSVGIQKFETDDELG